MKRTVNLIRFKMTVFIITASMAVGAAPAQAAEGEGTRIYYIGNSLTDHLGYEGFVRMAAAGGEKVVWGRQMAPGCTIDMHAGMKDTGGMNVPKYGNWGKAFSEFEWDAMTLQPFGRPFEQQYPAALELTRELIKKSLQAQVYIYAQWPSRSGGDGQPLPVSNNWDIRFDGAATFATPSHSKAAKEFHYSEVVAKFPEAIRERYLNRSYKSEYEAYVHGINAEGITNKPARLIPVGHVMQLLGQKMRAGLMPGYRSPWNFYADEVHVTNDGTYIVACTFYATIFGKSPVGLPVGDYQQRPGFFGSMVQITPELAKIIQETVWEVVASHPLTGVTSSEPLRVATPILAEATANQPYRYELFPAFGKPPYRWSIASGALSDGLALAEYGVIHGSPTKPGEFRVTAEVTDAAGAKAKHEFTLTVREAAPLVVPEQKLPAANVGGYFEHRLVCSGGIDGENVWSVKEGDLPPGLRLDSDGRLWGASGREGVFTFSVAASCGTGAGAQKAERALELHVGPPSGDVAIARRLKEPPAFDAHKKDFAPDPSQWDFRYPIKKLVNGDAATVVGAFDVAYTDDFLWVAVKIEDSAKNVAPNPNGPAMLGDYVVACVDGLNNREIIYNQDDRYCPLQRGQVYPHRELTVGDSFQITGRNTEIDGGWMALFRIDKRVTHVRSQRQTLRPGQVIGLDLMIMDNAREGNPASTIVWQGTKDNRTDPSKFGTVVLGE
jgi:hypothetical protein